MGRDRDLCHTFARAKVRRFLLVHQKSVLRESDPSRPLITTGRAALQPHAHFTSVPQNPGTVVPFRSLLSRTALGRKRPPVTWGRGHRNREVDTKIRQKQNTTTRSSPRASVRYLLQMSLVPDSQTVFENK